jgi:hypothetical protein
MPEPQLSATFERAKALSAIAASVLIPLAIALSGHWFSAALKERETQLKYVELAVGILREKPDPTAGQVRSWAVQVVDKFAPVPLSNQATDELRQRQLLLERKAVDEVEKVLKIIPKIVP